MMKKKYSYIEPHECKEAAKKLRLWAEIGGRETAVCNEKERDFFEYFLSADSCIKAAEHFEHFQDKGEYYSNIIKYPFFLSSEIEAVLTVF